MGGVHDNLVERYVYAVTKRLPTAQRQDVSMELHSLIDKMVQNLRIGTVGCSGI